MPAASSATDADPAGSPAIPIAPLTLADASVRRDNNFNLMRLVAAWLVIYGHAYPISGSAGQDLILASLQFKFAGGVAVDLFFFISGFLIASSLARHGLREYLVARVLRIYPALIVCVLLTVFVLGPMLSTDAGYWRDPATWRYLWLNSTLLDTAYVLPGVFSDHPNGAVNGSLWSLPIELRLYLVLAAIGLLGLFKPERFNVCFIAAMTLGFLLYGSQTLSPEHSNYAYCGALFFTGAFCWINRTRIPLSWPLLFLLLCGAAALHGGARFHIGYVVVLSYGALMLAFVPRLPVLRTHDLSYGVYLYGWPSQQLVQHLWPTAGWAGNVLGGTLLAVALAWASWTWIEAPALRLKRRLVNARPPTPPRGE